MVNVVINKLGYVQCEQHGVVSLAPGSEEGIIKHLAKRHAEELAQEYVRKMKIRERL